MSYIVAIIGRPNVGKSSLFNRMIRKASASKSSAIIESIPGVTRDRNYRETEWEGKRFIVVDTGGFYAEGIPGEKEEIAEQVKEQAMLAIEESDLIIHLLDGKEGYNPLDKELANILRKSGKKVLWVVNKIDTPAKENRIQEFYAIGTDEIIPVSAVTGYGFDDFMDKIASTIPASTEMEAETEDKTEEIPKIAVVGRPNAGKSTLINSLLGKKRLIVSSVPGTTRDAIDSICGYYGKKYLLIDTAGIKKKSRLDSIERFSVIRALKSIERADVVVIVIDISAGITEQDQKIAGAVEEYGKGAIFLINKWDLVKEPEKEYRKIERTLKNKMWFIDYAPFITASGLERKRITKIFPLIDEVIAWRKKRIPTAELNKFLSAFASTHPFPLHKGKGLKLQYITQVDIKPPAFRLFVNRPLAVKDQHIRHLEKKLREEYSFKGTPIRIYVNPKNAVKY
jgi:GTP-binding protein